MLLHVRAGRALTLALGGLLAVVSLAHAETVSPGSLLVLGPIPLPPAATPDGPLVPQVETVLEVDPANVDPWVGDEIILNPSGAVRWRTVDVTSGLDIGVAGVYWLASRLEMGRHGDVTFRLEGCETASLYVDGEELAVNDDGEPPEAEVGLARGSHMVLARVEVATTASISLSAADGGSGAASWTVERRHPLAIFDQARAIRRLGPLAVDVKGEHIARRVRLPGADGEPQLASVDILSADGRVVEASVGDSTAVPVAFSPDPDASALLLTQEGEHGTDLVLFDLATGSTRTVVRDEPDLELVRWSPGGSHLLVVSSRGCVDLEPGEDDARRRHALYEKLPDYDPRPHLHLVEIATGARLRLTSPGDWVVDDAVFVAARRAVLYTRTVPRDERPWFVTEFRLKNLVTGEDSQVATFSAGWENRPKSLAPGPRGKRVAFLGPPAEIGPAGPDHNVYQSAIYLLDVDAGTFHNITVGSPHAFAGGGDLLAWKHNGRHLLATLTEGSRTRLARLTEGPEGWNVELLEHRGEVLGHAAASWQGTRVAYVASSRNMLPRVLLMDLEDDKATVIDEPNAEVAGRWTIGAAEDAAFTGPSGVRIDAWWYPPTVAVDSDSTPLVVYYYGGAQPTSRRFNVTHQVLAGNGYAVLVINPRGAVGYGLDFADAHVNDWGPAAAEDILAGIDAFLGAHPDIDGDRIGIYGGSYGGFMTGYLVASSDRFAAAVSLFGITNIASYWGAGVWGYTYGDVALGSSLPWSERELYVERSPLYRADKITTPLLLMHGLDDSNVPPGESEQLYTALKVLGRDVELVTFPGEDHGISSSFDRRAEHRTMIVEFFDRHLRGQGEAWDARWE